ncbi:MAG TPA: GNAT family N-acetyltransferase [Xanthobacteraceae bacterium]|nr:GNAT family N-acetyltransferase [Xanthobacteraceae bacterium]
MSELHISVIGGMGEIGAAEWNACANPPDDSINKTNILKNIAASSCETKESGIAAAEISDQVFDYNPFLSHEFFAALEASHSVGPRTGWQPQHVLARTHDGTLVAAAPAYLKSHSRGEYVFDAGWADAYERAGGQYYPKLQIAVPFTPATGRRLLVRREEGLDEDAIRRAVGRGLSQLCTRSGISGVHVTFATETECNLLGELDYLRRTDQQFHWENHGFASFDDFLGAMTARKRKTIKRERHDALTNGIEVHWLTGSDLTEEIWDAFFEFYMETGSRKWGRPYLTRSFYSLVGETMRDRVLLVMAKRAGRWIAGAINFIGSRTLFGRHWGAIEHHPFLHFELCYYQAIDYAITHKLSRVEAGAQGEHKISRGYMPTTTHSAHYIADPGLRRAIADYLVRERAYVEASGSDLAELAPFRKDFAAEQD